MQKQKRLIWIDWAKALLIGLVICGHIGLDDRGMNSVCTFYMPAFFIISGYLYKSHSCLDTLRSCLPPVLLGIAFNAIFYTVMGLLPFWHGNQIGMGSVAGLWKCDFEPGNAILFPGFWFVFAWIICKLLLDGIPVIRRKTIRRAILVICVTWMGVESVIGVSESIQYLYIYRVIAAMPMMLLGMELKESRCLEKIHSYRNSVKVLMFALAIGASTLIGSYANEIDMWCNHYGMNFAFFFVSSALISVGCFVGMMLLPESRIIKTLSTGTLVILGLHYVLREVLLLAMSFVGISCRSWWVTLILCCIIIAVLYPFLRWCEDHAPWLLGKRTRHRAA